MQYRPGAVEGRDAAAARHAEEISRRLPIQPWSELESMPGAGTLADFSGATDLLDVSATGLVFSGTIYLQACQTAYGEYPYCPAMRHGPFSVTKSMGAAVALLRLAHKYGPEVLDERISDFVQVDARHDGWENVTFGDALNMATGIGDRAELAAFTGEEDERKFYAFMEAKSAADKLAIIATYGKYPWGPGTVARYNTINTFMLSVAMDRFLKAREGPQADIWDMVTREVYEPIGIYHAPIMRTIEPDGKRGIPILGYGLYPTVDDAAKVALLWQNGGRHAGQQLLHAGLAAQALRKSGWIGLPTGQSGRHGEIGYGLSFWSAPYPGPEGATIHIPYMSGYGGNLVVLNPNGVIGFRFADGFDFDVEPLAAAADAME
jgi:CubicO group peptidase (beta-lactamase class C family)